jgi:tRNA A-37 threonylcarbamoyl transferase component Bud32/membrane-associated phospholipid phosphatase
MTTDSPAIGTGRTGPSELAGHTEQSELAGHTDAKPAPNVVRKRPRRRPSGEAPPLPRQLNASGWGWLGLAGFVLIYWIVVAVRPRAALWLVVADHWALERISALRAPWLTTVMTAAGLLATGTALMVMWWIALAILLVWRRWRHLFVWLGALLAVSNLTAVAADLIQRPRPVGIEILGHWEGFAMPSRPMAVLAAVLICALYALIPAGRPRELGKVIVAVVLGVTALSRLYLAQDAPIDVLNGVVFGVAIPLAAFRLFTPTAVYPVTYRRGRTAHLDISGRRLEAIERALHDQLGVIPTEIKPFGLSGSGGSTPMRVKLKGEPETYLFAKLYARSHMRSDRWYKLGRTLMYGRLEDEKAFNTVRRLVQYEDYMLRLMRDAGLPVPHPYGILEITPDVEYVLVAEMLDGAQEMGDAPVDDSVIDQSLDIVRRLWDGGLAHRDIKPANLMVREGRVHLIDSAFGQVRPSPWRQAVDLGNMMLVLALRTDPRRVYERALRKFNVDEITEAFAATRGLTMPSQLRTMIRQQGRDLHSEFCALLPQPPQPIRIQRWSVRRVLLTTWVLFMALIALSIVIELLKSPL